jgi:hypothetical protein
MKFYLYPCVNFDPFFVSTTGTKAYILEMLTNATSLFILFFVISLVVVSVLECSTLYIYFIFLNKKKFCNTSHPGC